MKLIIAEKPSVAKSIASALGVNPGPMAFQGMGASFPGAWATLFPRWTRRAITIISRNGAMTTFPFFPSPSAM